jgi:RNA polymerase sigma-70 factor, ECF subfamily
MIEDEYEVIRKVQQGDINQFNLLVLKYQSAIFKLLFNMLNQHSMAEELTQEVFIKSYENLNSFNFNSRFFSWIYRIAINTAISHKKKLRPFIGFENVAPETEISAEATIISNEREIILKQAIEHLAEKHKLVIMLKYFEGLSYSEIAEILKINEERVKSRLFDARKRLKTILEKNNYF